MQEARALMLNGSFILECMVSIVCCAENYPVLPSHVRAVVLYCAVRIFSRSHPGALGEVGCGASSRMTPGNAGLYFSCKSFGAQLSQTPVNLSKGSAVPSTTTARFVVEEKKVNDCVWSE